MALNYAYNYAFVDPVTRMCMTFQSVSYEITQEEVGDTYILVEVPVNDPEYCLKYYINGNWYEDAEGTIPWTSSLL